MCTCESRTGCPLGNAICHDGRAAIKGHDIERLCSQQRSEVGSKRNDIAELTSVEVCNKDRLQWGKDRQSSEPEPLVPSEQVSQQTQVRGR